MNHRLLKYGWQNKRVIEGAFEKVYHTDMCHSCGYIPPRDEKIFRSSLCPGCGKDLRVCLNCVFYQPGAHWDCRETISEPVTEKDRANFCDYFTPNSGDRKASGGNNKAEEARSKLKDLFGT